MATAALALAAAGCVEPCGEDSLCVVVGSGELGFNGDGLPALDTRVATPMSVTASPDGALLFVDFSNMRLRTLTEDDTVQTVVGSGFHAFSQIGAPALESPLENPIDARWGPDGMLYIAPFHEGRVLRVDEAGAIELVACSGESLEHGGDGGPALDGTMGYPGGIAFADDGTLFISDWSHHRIRAVGADGVIRTVAGTGEAGMDPDGPGPSVRLDRPTFLDVDGDGGLLVADSGNHRVVRIDIETLALSTVAGGAGQGYSGDGGPATEAQLASPLAVLANPEGGFWVSDSGNDVVREVGIDGTIVTVAGDPASDERVDDAPALAFPLRTPAGLGLSPDGDLWIAERDGHRIVQWRRP